MRMASSEQPVLAQWVLDTRSWYPEATATRQLELHASRAFALLPPDVRPAVLRYYHVRDAKMALASALLKHYAVARLSHTPWSQLLATPSAFTRDARTKPVYVDPATGAQPVSFNVSHQAGIVAIVAVVNPLGPSSGDGGNGSEDGDSSYIQVGVDVVCTSERRERDLAMINPPQSGGGGWQSFVDMHAEVFSPREVAYLKYHYRPPLPLSPPPPSTVTAGTTGRGAGQATAATATDDDARLRAFYALWALREAYVKLTGEALLADWLRELEFRDVRPPRPTVAWEVPAREEEEDSEAGGDGDEEVKVGEVVRKIDIWFRGRRVQDVNMCLRSVGPDYMIATAVRTPGREEEALGWRLGPYEALTLEEVLEFAEGGGGR